MPYFASPLTTDPTALMTQVLEDIQAQFPDWEGNEGNLEVVLAAAIVNTIAEVRDVASDVPDEIFRTAGTLLFDTPSIEAAPATADVTVTVVDDVGYTLPEGTEMAAALSGSDSLAFRTTEDLTIAPGDTTGTVSVECLEDGTAGNDLTGDLTLLNPLYAWVDTLAFSGASSGGVDAETNDAYLSRLTARLRLLTPRPILPGDFAALAFDVAGVGRATAVDGYDADLDTYDNERTVTVFVTDSDGADLSSGLRSDVADYLEGLREVNFLVYVEDPTRTTIEVTAEVAVLAGYDSAAVITAVEDALTNYLNPAAWGAGVGGDSGTAATWANTPDVRYLEVATVINEVAGVDYVVSLGIAEEGDPPGTADLSMTGPAPLPEVGTLTITTT